MKIVFAAPFGLGQKTTVWARTLPLAQHLVDRGHEAAIVIPPWDTPEDAGTHTVTAGVEMVHVALAGGIPGTTRRMLGEIHTRRPEIVHIVKPRAHAGLVQWWLWQRRRLTHAGPTLVLDVDDWEQAWNEINDYGATLSRFLAWQEEWGIRHADGITAASRWLEQRVQAYAPQTPRLYLPNGVTPAEHAPVRPAADAPPVVLYYTRFVEVTPAWLAACWQRVRTEHPAARLLVAGTPLQPGRDATFRQEVVSALRDGGASIDWLGFVTPPMQRELYARAHCAIFPARAEPLQQAKCSVRLATTLLHGVPVVASAVGEQRSYGGDGAARLVAAEATPHEFGAAVSALLDDPAARRAMTDRAATRLVAAFNWADSAAQLADFYTQILTGRARA